MAEQVPGGRGVAGERHDPGAPEQVAQLVPSVPLGAKARAPHLDLRVVEDLPSSGSVVNHLLLTQLGSGMSLDVFLSFRKCPKHPNTPPFDVGTPIS